MRRLLPLLAVLLCVPALSQNFQRYNLSYQDLTEYNPAASMDDRDWQSLYFRFNLDSPEDCMERTTHIRETSLYGVGDNSTVIFTVARDRYSWFRDYCIKGGFAHGWSFAGGRGQINAGVTMSLDFDRVVWENAPVATVNTGRKLFLLPDVSAGLEFRYGGFRAGASVLNAASPSYYEHGDLLLNNPRMFVSHMSLDLNDRATGVTLTPFVLALYDTNVSVDMGLAGNWERIIFTSYAYRNNERRHMVTGGFHLPYSPFDFHLGFSWSDTLQQKYLTFVIRTLIK